MYVGEWFKNAMHGKGKLSWGNGNIVCSRVGQYYDGEFLSGQKHGLGTFEWRDGTKYVGMWVNGKQSGEGELHMNGKVRKGYWMNGERMRWDN